MDGVYHRKEYDISEIDSKANVVYRTKGAKTFMTRLKPPSESIMEMMYGKRTLTATAVEMVKTCEILRYLIGLKWQRYRKLFILWFLLYMAILIWVTGYMALRIDFLFKGNTTRNSSLDFFSLSGHNQRDFTVVTAWMLLPIDVFGFALLLMLLFSRTVGRNNPIVYTQHNLDYVLSFLIFVVGIMVDSAIILTGRVNSYNGEALVIAAAFGWWFATIFLRPFKQFGRIVDLVRRFFTDDILSFASLFIILLVGFAAGLHSLFKYKVVDSEKSSDLVDDHRTFWRSSFTLFNVMLGLTEIHSDENSIYDTSASWLVISMYIVFIVIAYALLLNALIAIMTYSVGSIFEDAYDYQRVHKLSVLIFMEELFGLYHIFRYQLLLCEPREVYVKEDKRDKKEYRTFAEMKMKEHDSEESQVKANQESQLERRRNRTGVHSEEEIRALFKDELTKIKSDITNTLLAIIQEQNGIDDKTIEAIADIQTNVSESGYLEQRMNSLISKIEEFNVDVNTKFKAVGEDLRRLEDLSHSNETKIVHTVETVCKQCGKTESVQSNDETIKLEGSQKASEYNTTLSIS